MNHEERSKYRECKEYLELICSPELAAATAPSEFYRVCVKARIRNSRGGLYLVKEGGSGWTLPGGGVETGETIEEALRRELEEEIRLSVTFSQYYVGCQSVYIPFRHAWAFWIIFDVNIESLNDLGCGRDADDAAFIEIDSLASSSNRAEQLTYMWAR